MINPTPFCRASAAKDEPDEDNSKTLFEWALERHVKIVLAHQSARQVINQGFQVRRDYYSERDATEKHLYELLEQRYGPPPWATCYWTYEDYVVVYEPPKPTRWSFKVVPAAEHVLVQLQKVSVNDEN